MSEPEAKPWYKKDVRELFRKEDSAASGAAPDAPLVGLPQLPPELANDPKAKGAMALLWRKWKDPAFLKQIRSLAGHMQRDGVDLKDRHAVQAWLEKNKERVEKGELAEEPTKPGETYVKTGPELGRNDPCHCGSGKKFKKCHGS